jgi:hypothetical protein
MDVSARGRKATLMVRMPTIIMGAGEAPAQDIATIAFVEQRDGLSSVIMPATQLDRLSFPVRASGWAQTADQGG